MGNQQPQRLCSVRVATAEDVRQQLSAERPFDLIHDFSAVSGAVGETSGRGQGRWQWGACWHRSLLPPWR